MTGSNSTDVPAPTAVPEVPSTRDQVVILEYDQSDRIGYVFTVNGDRTFAIDLRVRRTF